jgi:hypothetical protein
MKHPETMTPQERFLGVQGGVQPLVYAEMDTPEILQAWLGWDMERGTRAMELALPAYCQICRR